VSLWRPLGGSPSGEGQRRDGGAGGAVRAEERWGHRKKMDGDGWGGGTLLKGHGGEAAEGGVR
jgi:hypothetical protein